MSAEQLRYWDGARWTEHVGPLAAAGSDPTPPIKAPALRFSARIGQACAPLLPTGEIAQYAWPAKKGIGSSGLVLFTIVTQLLLAFQSFRVVAVTDRQVYVFKAGWFTRTKPRRLLFTLPRDGSIVQLGAGRFRIGEEKLRLDGGSRRVAQAAIAHQPLPPMPAR